MPGFSRAEARHYVRNWAPVVGYETGSTDVSSRPSYQVPWGERQEKHPPGRPEDPLKQPEACEHRDHCGRGEQAHPWRPEHGRNHDQALDGNRPERQGDGDAGDHGVAHTPVNRGIGGVRYEVVLDGSVQDPADAAFVQLRGRSSGKCNAEYDAGNPDRVGPSVLFVAC